MLKKLYSFFANFEKAPLLYKEIAGNRSFSENIKGNSKMAQRPKNLRLLDNKTSRKTKKELDGRKKITEEFQSIPAKLQCPEDMDGIARTTWIDIVKLCSSSDYNFLNDLDRDLLRCYCDSVERYSIARKTWTSTCKKQIAHDKPGHQKIIDKCILEMSRAGDEIWKYARALNITSAERERLAIANGKFMKKQKSSILGFMNDN